VRTSLSVPQVTRATRRKLIAQYGQPLFGKCAHCNTDVVYNRQFEKLAAGSQIVCTTCAYRYTFEDRHLNRASYSLGRMVSIL
jgi:DNA-directed RNA polymerase subunit RPC12/RpoP